MGTHKDSKSKSGKRRRNRRRRRNRNKKNRDHQQRGGRNHSVKKNSRRSKNKSSNGGRNQRDYQRTSSRSNGSRNKSQRKTKDGFIREAYGGREPVDHSTPSRKGPLELNAFELFCAYHLGITDDNRYRKPRANEIARRFDISIKEMHKALHRFSVDKSSLDECDFDLSLAQLDIRVAPDGVDRRELAKVHFEELIMMHRTAAGE